jgi:hypothetical protein
VLTIRTVVSLGKTRLPLVLLTICGVTTCGVLSLTASIPAATNCCRRIAMECSVEFILS